MEKFGSVEAILDFAIGEEERAAELYLGLAIKMDKSWMVEVFEEFAAEEKVHKQKLEAVKRGEKLRWSKQKLADMKIADYVVEVEAQANMGYQDALILAMKKEKSAFKLYSDLAASTDDEDLREAFLCLAQEEAKHKLRFEIEYDNLIE
ncbi:MAG: ferritin-like domain-containing protein [Sedimentisphaerales bacterium]|nr:ferritin-like domain-containing protein [Sedimentisphaerales bacterium]